MQSNHLTTFKDIFFTEMSDTCCGKYYVLNWQLGTWTMLPLYAEEFSYFQKQKQKLYKYILFYGKRQDDDVKSSPYECSQWN